jgi:hypothetical protein
VVASSQVDDLHADGLNDRRSFEVELPAGNGVGTARAIAQAYSVFAEGGAELGIGPETFARITAVPQVARPEDEALGLPSYFSLGFLPYRARRLFRLWPTRVRRPRTGLTTAVPPLSASTGSARCSDSRTLPHLVAGGHPWTAAIARARQARVAG